MNIHENITELIGNTPMVYLRNFGKGMPGTMAAKLELFNPYSIKDRPVREMIAAGERDGIITKDTTIIEATSGNTGLALAFICAMKGYKLTICMSEIQTEERKRLLKTFGAKLELTPASEGTTGSKKRAMELAASLPNAFYIEQHGNPNNTLAHRKTTGPELWKDTDGEIDIMVAGLGTTGTLMGVAEAIKPKKPSFRIVGVEPAIAAMISKGEFTPHRQAGTSPGFIPKLYQPDLLDEVITVTEQDSYDACRELAKKEGILAGITSGMTAWAARELAAKEENSDKLIVAIFADTGQRYLSMEGLY
jgi:cysteine synthase